MELSLYSGATGADDSTDGRACNCFAASAWKCEWSQLSLLARLLRPCPCLVHNVLTIVLTGLSGSRATPEMWAADCRGRLDLGGYTLFGLFSKPPGAAEMMADRSAGGALEVAAVQPDAPAQDEPRARREGEATASAAVTTAAAAPAAKEAGATPIGRFEPVPGFATYNLGVQYYPRFAAAYFDRGVVLYRIGDFDRPFTDISSAKRPTDLKRTKNATPVPRKPLMIVPPVPERREPITAALTP